MKTHTFDRILLAVDGSPQSRNAVEVVADFASESTAVGVLNIWNQKPPGSNGALDAGSRADANRLVQGFASLLGASGLKATPLTRIARGSRIAREIVEAANSFGADLIVMGSRGRSDLGGLFLGSVSHEVVARTDRPVLIVRAAPRHPTTNRKIVLALAGGEEVPSALTTTIGVARSWGAEVLVLHVARVVTAEAIAWVEPDDDAQKAVDAALKRLRDAGVYARGRIVTSAGSIANEIAEVAGSWDADLIVVGSRRLGELRGLLSGATDHVLVHRIETPVLVAERSSRA